MCDLGDMILKAKEQLTLSYQERLISAILLILKKMVNLVLADFNMYIYPTVFTLLTET